MLIASISLLSTPPAPPRPSSQTDIVSFVPGEVACADGIVAASGIVRPQSVVSTRYGTAITGPAPSYRFTFAIDAQGRATTIRHDLSTASTFYVDTSDVTPSLAASRFPAGAPHSGCSIRYQAMLSPINDASMPVLYELASRREGNVAAIADRVRPIGSTCLASPGQYRRLNLPAFEKLPPPAGGPAWVFLAYDVDRAGRTRDVRVLGSSGDAALDRAGVAAVRDNRYAPGPAHRGCTYHFDQAAGSDRPSPPLPADAPRDNGDEPGCKVDPKSIESLYSGRAYPTAFSRRRIEGVAIIGYDTAPWGAVGDVKVLLSEPAEAFGDAARDAFSSARVAESEAGRRGCVQRVRFRLPPSGAAE